MTNSSRTSVVWRVVIGCILVLAGWGAWQLWQLPQHLGNVLHRSECVFAVGDTIRSFHTKTKTVPTGWDELQEIAGTSVNGTSLLSCRDKISVDWHLLEQWLAQDSETEPSGMAVWVSDIPSGRQPQSVLDVNELLRTELGGGDVTTE